MGKLSELYYMAVCISNDFKHIHAHVIGDKFDRVHDIAQGYYERAAEDADAFLELALEYNQSCSNPSLATEMIGYKPNNQSAYSYYEAMQSIYDIIEKYIDMLDKSQSGLDEDVVNLIQEYQRYWKKENRYKNIRRMEVIT